MKEADLQRAIVKKLLRPYKKERLLDFQCGFEGIHLAPRQRVQANQQGRDKGCPDIRLFFPKGIACFVELKLKGNYLTAEQKDDKELLSSLGFDWYTLTAKNPDDAVAQMREIIDKYI